MVRDDFQVAPGVVPETKEEALLLAQAWGHTLSHNNIMIQTERYDGEQPCRGETLVNIARADAAEVQRLAALWTMLPESV